MPRGTAPPPSRLARLCAVLALHVGGGRRFAAAQTSSGDSGLAAALRTSEQEAAYVGRDPNADAISGYCARSVRSPLRLPAELLLPSRTEETIADKNGLRRRRAALRARRSTGARRGRCSWGGPAPRPPAPTTCGGLGISSRTASRTPSSAAPPSWVRPFAQPPTNPCGSLSWLSEPRLLCADVDETVAQCSEIWTADELCGGAILEMQEICGAGSAALPVDAEEVSRSDPNLLRAL